MSNDDDQPVAWHSDDIDAEAARWFARHRSGEERPGDAAAFASWSADPAARDAYALVQQSWDAIGLLDGHPDLVALEARKVRRPRWPWVAGAAALAASVAAVVMMPRTAQSPAVVAEAQPPLRFASRVGERMPVALADGSLVTLDTDSAITVEMDARRRLIELTRGRAYFKVQKAAGRPFVVRAGGRSVIAVGTRFSVDAGARGLDVVLVEGRVRVVRSQATATGNRIEMIPGDRLSIGADGQMMLRKADTARETAWMSGKLVFDEARLGDVAAALNRYSARKIIFADPRVADRRISAVLGTGDTASFVSAVETMHLGRARETADRLVIDRP